MTKKILAIVLILQSLCSFSVMPSVHGAELLSDLEEMNMLVEIGIIKAPEDDKLQVVDTIERGDFAVMLATIILGGGVIPSVSDKIIFTDIAPDSEQGQAVKLVVEKEIMSGFGDGTFRPDISITYQDVLTCLVRFLGVGDIAVEKGGYPTGYINQASEMGLTKNVKCQYTSYLNYDGLTTVLCNLLNAPVMSLSYNNNSYGQPFYYLNDENTVLTEYFNVYQANGIMTANDKTSLDGVSGRKGTVVINGIDYEIGESNASEYLGYNVKIYYKQEKEYGEKTIVSIRPYEAKHNTVEILAEDIESLTLEKNSREMRLEYYEDEDKKNTEILKISKKVYIIKNEMALMDYNVSELVPLMGSIMLIDNDNDGLYDVMSIKDYQIMLVGQVSTAFETITDKYRIKNGEPYKMIFDSANEDISFIMNGKEASLSDIKMFDVLTIYKSERGLKNKIVVEITRESITGVAQSFSEENKTIKINGEKYPVNQYYINYLKEYGKTVQIGNENTFYLDRDGKISGTQENILRGEYGYFRKIYENDTEMGTGVRLYNVKSNTWYTYEFAEKVSIDSKSYTEDAARSVLSPNVYRYELDSNGEIRKIYTPVDALGGFTMLKKNAMINAFGVNDLEFYFCDGLTGYLRIPEDEENFNNEKAYFNYFTMADREYYSIQLLDVDGYNIGLAVWKTPFSGVSDSYNPEGYIVTDITTSINEDNDLVGTLSLIGEWGEVNVTLSQECTESEQFSNLRKGDMIRINKGADEIVTGITVDVSSEEIRTSSSSYGNIYMWYGHIYGEITYVNTAKGIFGIEVNGVEYANRIPGVVIVNKENGKHFSIGNENDITVGQKAVFRIREGLGRFVQILG